MKKKIELKKETIANLSNEEMTNVQGGALWTLICKSKKCDETVVLTICTPCPPQEPDPIDSMCQEQACSVTPTGALSGCEGIC